MTWRLNHRYLFLLATVLVAGVGSAAYWFYTQPPKPRTLDTMPVVRYLKTPVHAGTAETLFEIDSRGTQKGFFRTEAGLVVVVRYGDTEYRQTFASCKQPEVGIRGVLLEMVTKLQPLEIANCGDDEDEFWLLSVPGKVFVNRMKNDLASEEIVSIETPKNIRAMPYEPLPEPRTLDAKPVESRLKVPLPSGRAEAYFEMVLTGDQMAMPSTEVGLSVVVRYADHEYRQLFASCRHPASGSALGGATERILDVAICNNEYWLISEPGWVSVQRRDQSQTGTEILRFEIPNKIRAVIADRKHRSVAM